MNVEGLINIYIHISHILIFHPMQEDNITKTSRISDTEENKSTLMRKKITKDKMFQE